MSVFTDAEIEFLTSHRLGRLATVNAAGEPHVVPCRYRYNPDSDTLDIGGHGMATSKKMRDARATRRVAFVVDDMPERGRPRGIEVRGRAEIYEEGGEQVFADFDPQFVRLLPTHIAAWGVEPGPFEVTGRDVAPSGEQK